MTEAGTRFLDPPRSCPENPAMPPSDHFLPFRREAVARMCVEREGLADAERERFRTLARMLAAVYHYELHDRLEALHDAYAPFDPDRDTRVEEPPDAAARAALRRGLVEDLEAILEQGNYVRIGEEELQRALEEESLFHIRLEIDFDDLEEVLFYRRGEAVQQVSVPRFWGLRTRTIDVPIYERVLMFVVLKHAAHFAAKKRKHLPFVPGSMILKLFSDIPRADLEMLFPNAEIRMRGMDKLVMGVPAVVTGAIVVATRLTAVIGLVVALFLFWLGIAQDRPVIDSARLVALGAGLAALTTFAAKQWLNYKNRKIRFMKALTESLYFKNLANNRSVLDALVDRAEGEELKESLLAYRFLLEEPLSQEALDERIERWLRERHDADVDFDAEDALAKLERLGLAAREDDLWRVVPLDEALRRLDAAWDAYFAY